MKALNKADGHWAKSAQQNQHFAECECVYAFFHNKPPKNVLILKED